MPLENLTRARIITALNLLGLRAQQEGVELELCIYGGSAMMLAYSSRETTKDVDAIVRPSEVALRLAQDVAQQLGLHESWLNDDVKQFVSDAGTFAPLQIEELEDAARRHLKITQDRVLDEPWFSEELPVVRLLLLRDTPSAFKDKNVFVFDSALRVA